MTIDDILQAIHNRKAMLRVRNGSLRYVGVSPLGPDDPLRAMIREHRAELISLLPESGDFPSGPVTDQATKPRSPTGNPVALPCVNPGMLMTVGHYHGYPRLPLKPGVSIAQGATAWRTFTRTADANMLALAAQAARETWADDPMTNDLYYLPRIDPDAGESCRNENGACQESTREQFDADNFLDDYRAEQEDRHLEHGPARGLA